MEVGSFGFLDMSRVDGGISETIRIFKKIKQSYTNTGITSSPVNIASTVTTLIIAEVKAKWLWSGQAYRQDADSASLSPTQQCNGKAESSRSLSSPGNLRWELQWLIRSHYLPLNAGSISACNNQVCTPTNMYTSVSTHLRPKKQVLGTHASILSCTCTETLSSITRTYT